MLSESELNQMIRIVRVGRIATEMLVVMNSQWSRVCLNIHYLLHRGDHRLVQP